MCPLALIQTLLVGKTADQSKSIIIAIALVAIYLRSHQLFYCIMTLACSIYESIHVGPGPTNAIKHQKSLLCDQVNINSVL